MNVKRIKDLIETLELVKAGKFKRCKNPKFEMDVFVDKKECGTAACAAGFYSLRFPNRGIQNFCTLVDLGDHFDIPWDHSGRLFNWGEKHKTLTQVIKNFKKYLKTKTIDNIEFEVE